MTRHRTPPICYMSAKKFAVYRSCKALITRTRTAESRFSVILTFLEGCTATDADVSEQAALHASTAGNPRAQRRTSAHCRKTWSTADYMQSGRRVHEHRCVLASRGGMLANTVACWQTQSRVGERSRVLANTAACWRTQPRVGMHGRMTANTAGCTRSEAHACIQRRLLACCDARLRSSGATSKKRAVFGFYCTRV